MYVQQQRNVGRPPKIVVSARCRSASRSRAASPRRGAVHLRRAADPAEHRVGVRRELVPLLDVGLDRPLGDVLDRESGRAQRVEVEVERPRREEHPVAPVEVRRIRSVVEHVPVGGVRGIGADEPGRDLVHDVHGLVDDPLVLGRGGCAGSRVDPDAPAGASTRPAARRPVEVVVEVDRVRRDEWSAPGTRADGLVDVLEPPLVLQVVVAGTRRAPRRGSGPARRGGTSASCRDEHPDLAVEDPEPQAVEQDAGAAGVVDEHVAVAQVLGELLDGEVEVAVPAVVLDRVVVEAEGVDRLLPSPRPGCAESLPARRTAHRRRDVRDRTAEADVPLDELRTTPGRASPAARRRDAERIERRPGEGDPPPRPSSTSPGCSRPR